MAETAQNVSMTDVGDIGTGKEKVHHTVTACVRCRQVRLREHGAGTADFGIAEDEMRSKTATV